MAAPAGRSRASCIGWRPRADNAKLPRATGDEMTIEITGIAPLIQVYDMNEALALCRGYQLCFQARA